MLVATTATVSVNSYLLSRSTQPQTANLGLHRTLKRMRRQRKLSNYIKGSKSKLVSMDPNTTEVCKLPKEFKAAVFIFPLPKPPKQQS